MTVMLLFLLCAVVCSLIKSKKHNTAKSKRSTFNTYKMLNYEQVTTATVTAIFYSILLYPVKVEENMSQSFTRVMTACGKTNIFPCPNFCCVHASSICQFNLFSLFAQKKACFFHLLTETYKNYIFFPQLN